MENRKVNLFVVGAMKAGTTSFSDMLAQHPEIYMSPIKEPHYFLESLPKNIYEPSRFFNLETYFEKDFPNQLHIANLKNANHYKKLFSLAKPEHKYLVEASTGYLHDPNSASNIYNYNPNAKIIILLRDPLKRAFSQYKMDLGLGRTTKSFQKIMEEELNCYENGTLSNWSYLGMSLYAKNVERYNSKFGKNLLLLNISDFNLENNSEDNKLNFFLNIVNHPFVLEKNNVSRTLRFQKFFYVLQRSGIKNLFSYLLPKNLRQNAFKTFSTKGNLPLELDDDTQQKIENIFALDKELLNRLK